MSVEAPPAAPRPRPHWIVWLFALVGLAGVVALIVLATVVSNAFDRHRPAQVAGTKAEETFTVQSVHALPGTHIIQMEVGTPAPSGSYSGSGSDMRNILLLDRRTGASRRILPDNSRRIRQSRFLPARAEPGTATADDELLMGGQGGERQPAAYYLLEVEHQGDKDLEDLLVGRLADGKQAVVMSAIDGVDLTWMDSPTRLGLIVREKLRLHFRIVDIPSLKVVESRPIAID